MSQKLSSLSIFFPAYNEEGNIVESVKKAVTVAQRFTDNYEVIVVNDGSSDNTAEVVQDLVEADPRHIRLVNHAQNQGYGAALMSGFSNATKGWVFFTDADLQFDLDEIKKLVEYSDKYDVILGYRMKRSDPFMRLLNAKGWNILNRLIFGLKVKDVDCAFKLFRTDAVKPILRQIQSRGAMFSAELLIRLHRGGYKFVEVGVNHYARTVGSATGAKLGVIIRAFKELAMVYRGDLGHDWVKETTRFIIVGGFNTVIDLLSYFALTRMFGYFGNHRMWAKGLSYLIGVVNSVIWNRAISLGRSGLTPFNPLLLATILLGALAVNTSVMYVLYESLQLPEYVAILGATASSFVWNLLFSKVSRA